MFDFTRGQRVQIAVNGQKVPGVVTDERVAPRDVQTRRGVFHIPDSIVVISLRQPPNGPAFVVERAESVQFVAPRQATVKEIDGHTPDELRQQAFDSMLELQARRAKDRAGVTA
jgi:hypothetical protein